MNDEEVENNRPKSTGHQIEYDGMVLISTAKRRRNKSLLDLVEWIGGGVSRDEAVYGAVAS
jgi:hypothetical protein